MMFDLPQPFGPDDAGEIARKADRGRIRERLEAGDFDLGQAHLIYSERRRSG